jgi:hypothetical protein
MRPFAFRMLTRTRTYMYVAQTLDERDLTSERLWLVTHSVY